MAISLTDTLWEGEFSKTDGTPMSVVKVRFNADGSAHFTVRRSRTGEWLDWVKIWKWRQQGNHVEFGDLDKSPRESERYNGSIEGNRASGRGVNWGDNRTFWLSRLG